MKKLILALAATLFIGGIASAQNPIPQGGRFLNFGLGFSNHGIPLSVGMDFGVGNDISLGFDVTHRFNYDESNWGAAGLASYHFNRILNIPSEFDFYAGLNIGARFGDNSGLDLGAQIGGRYFFSDNVAFNLQFGGGNNFSGGKIGLTFRL
jgi:hypothetical protein